VLSGHTIVLGGFKRDDLADAKTHGSGLLYMLITARVIERNGVLESVLPVAFVNKADAEGFVRSPFAPEAKPIDVRGLPSGTELKCPTTRRLFRVP